MFHILCQSEVRPMQRSFCLLLPGKQRDAGLVLLLSSWSFEGYVLNARNRGAGESLASRLTECQAGPRHHLALEMSLRSLRAGYQEPSLHPEENVGNWAATPAAAPPPAAGGAGWRRVRGRQNKKVVSHPAQL